MAAGLIWLRANRAVGGVALLHALRALCAGAVASVLVVFALRDLEVAPGWYGAFLVSLPPEPAPVTSATCR